MVISSATEKDGDVQGGPDETRRAGGRRLGGGAWPTGCLLTMPRGPFRDVTEPRRTCKLSPAASARVAGRRAGDLLLGRPRRPSLLLEHDPACLCRVSLPLQVGAGAAAAWRPGAS